MKSTQAILKIPYRKLVWLLPIVLALHELEEWNIKHWNAANFVNSPDTPESAIRAVLILVVFIGFAITAISCLFKNPSVTAYISLPFFILVVFNNSISHIYWQLNWGVYAPGVITAAFLNIPIILLLSWHALANKLVSLIFLLTLYVSSIPSLIFTVKQGRIFPEVMLKVHELGINLSNISTTAP